MKTPISLLTLLIAALAGAFTPGRAQTTDDDLKVYAVNVVKQAPLEKQFTGYGIYLGGGKVITAAHVVGHFPNLTHPRVLIAGLDLPAEIIRQGSLEDTDLALLSIDETQLPVSLKLRRNPLCKATPQPGANVVVVYPEKTARARVLSPLFIAPQYRARFGSLITEQQGSGSGVFDSERRCLLGIISRKVQKFAYRRQNGRVVATAAGWAGYYVSLQAMRDFIPPELKF
jgi:hypothetical protein